MKRFLLLVLFLLLITAGATSVWVYRDLHTPVQHTKHGHYIDIPRGSSPATVINRLPDDAIIELKLHLMIFLILAGVFAHFKVGDDHLPGPIAHFGDYGSNLEGEHRVIGLPGVDGKREDGWGKEIVARFKLGAVCS